ncbi:MULTISPECIES: hypothetical protein [Halorubrum]|uniref:Uncharacterized protein n=1 Tax=Halorubrum laminariae TaxID=1433523 RepID=A0ABD6C7G1_9EURY|nr:MULTISPECIES: hypothetical protein [Halorubrum]MDB2273718.1 hypothetical protein [Halorubrum ezzemoulense]
MIQKLIDDYIKEYQQSDWEFHTRYMGPILLGLSQLAVLIVVVGTARIYFRASDFEVFLLILINCVIVPIVMWYPIRKAGF